MNAALYLDSVNRNFRNYYLKQNDQTKNDEEPFMCESIFIYSCEPKELSFKGKIPANSSLVKIAMPSLAVIGGFAASMFSSFRKGTTNEEDVKRIIQNQKDMEYICALKRDFVPYSDFDKTVLENYNKNLQMLENVNKALISKIVDGILSKKKFRDLPQDYSEKIKEHAYCLSTWAGDCFTLGEKDVECFISKLKEEDDEKAKKQAKEKSVTKEQNSYFNPKEMETVQLGKIEPKTLLNVFGLNPKTTPVSAVIDLIKAETKEEDEMIKAIDDIYKKVESGNITAKDAIDEVIGLLESIKIQPDCNCNGDYNSNINEGIIDIIT